MPGTAVGMNISAPAIVCAARAHGETGVVVRLLTEQTGLVAAYAAGGRGRQLRPVLIPGNLVAAEIRGHTPQQLPYARIELARSRGPWLTEPLPAAAIGWCCALTAATLPERHAYPALYAALGAMLDAVCHAPSARGWAPGLLAYEALLLRELGYGDGDLAILPHNADWGTLLAHFDHMGAALLRYPLADRRGDVMAARERLGALLARMGGAA